MTQTTLTALAGLLVLALQYFGWIVPQDAVLTVLAGMVTLYGIVKQHTTNKTLSTQLASMSAYKGVK